MLKCAKPDIKMMTKLFIEQFNFKYVFCINDNENWRVTANDIHNYLSD